MVSLIKEMNNFGGWGRIRTDTAFNLTNFKAISGRLKRFNCIPNDSEWKIRPVLIRYSQQFDLYYKNKYKTFNLHK
jgi:hypothetical protein